jgi:hypothetical protein
MSLGQDAISSTVKENGLWDDAGGLEENYGGANHGGERGA